MSKSWVWAILAIGLLGLLYMVDPEILRMLGFVVLVVLVVLVVAGLSVQVPAPGTDNSRTESDSSEAKSDSPETERDNLGTEVDNERTSQDTTVEMADPDFIRKWLGGRRLVDTDGTPVEVPWEEDNK